MATCKDEKLKASHPSGGIHHGGPDADSLAARDPQFNSQRGRDAESAGERGSNHIGQGSANPTSAPQPEANKARKGNSEQESFDEKDDQEMDMKLDDGP